MWLRWFYRFYGWLPKPFRTRLVRLVKPSFTVGTIPFVTRSDGRVLLVRHSYKPRWATPGGFVNRHEEPAVAAAREAMEEVGLAIEMTSEPTVVIDPQSRQVDVVFRARPAPGADPDDVRPCSSEIVEVRWFASTDLPELQDETAEALTMLLRAELGRVIELP